MTSVTLTFDPWSWPIAWTKVAVQNVKNVHKNLNTSPNYHDENNDVIEFYQENSKRRPSDTCYIQLGLHIIKYDKSQTDSLLVTYAKRRNKYDDTTQIYLHSTSVLSF